MKNLLIKLLFIFIASVPAISFASPVPSDKVVITNNSDGIYPSSSLNVPEGGTEPSGVFVGGSPIFGGDGWGVLNIFLTEPGTNIISDHLFSLAAESHFCNLETHAGADCIFFSSDPSTDPLIGTLCTLGRTFCIQETGLLQDVTFMVAAQNHGRGIFANGTISIQSDVDNIPEPASLMLLCLGFAGLAFNRRKQAI
ncbi:PEP-CTERM sorting domain-containing protein [Undibacterium sp.]|uniref:PEP-CTERM sorting domain-containing protein n=1 Tax=Undibacterium sp. TaxID=1914977 RepID=UPI002C30A816|nr:PEP-CTERM sorting domain-containing protein [Undibacterium sp.]HTD06356.1 PEP-CTERM sorting domain-containing protein [Undibacterium sp.]